eukprot:COSAG06_NODE_40867_length_397_cov_1.751678_1_plen_26_part_01
MPLRGLQRRTHTHGYIVRAWRELLLS